MSVSVKYKDKEITSMSESGTKTLKTALKLCENDIVVINTKDATLDTSDATASASDIKTGKTAYVNGSKITGTFTIQPTITQTITENGTTTISPSSSYGALSSVSITVNVPSVSWIDPES